ncbi:hypothetical protein Hanom_Chr14g01326791 [Helianthus anomalus]
MCLLWVLRLVFWSTWKSRIFVFVSIFLFGSFVRCGWCFGERANHKFSLFVNGRDVDVIE